MEPCREQVPGCGHKFKGSNEQESLSEDMGLLRLLRSGHAILRSTERRAQYESGSGDS